MAKQARTPQHDPAEGSLAVVERELQRKGSERKPAAPDKRPLERAAEWTPHTRAIRGRRRDSSRPR